jgi:3'-phosphoadenosine 5'-phosphosulfate sulfotransferase (PAPS reductase)/FAD synthetase
LKKSKPKMYIASCSFGKDSIATILLALENNEPLDRVVFSEVMFDHERGTSRADRAAAI